MVTRTSSARIVPAVDRAARILALIQSESRPMRITELAELLGVSKGTIREILETLRYHGLLERNEDTKRYRLGPELARLGAASRQSRSLVSIARPYLQALSDETRENVLLLVVEDDHLLIQDACLPSEPNAMIMVSATPGHTIPVHAGACGKVVAVWGSGLPRKRARSSVRRRVSSAGLERIRKRGYATDDQEFMEGVRAVCAPILDPQERPAALILVSGIAASMARNRLEQVGTAVRRAAISIGREIAPLLAVTEEAET